MSLFQGYALRLITQGDALSCLRVPLWGVKSGMICDKSNF